MTFERWDPKVRKDAILAAAMVVAKREGLTALGRANVANEAQVAASTVSKYWGDVAKLRAAVVKLAITRGELRIVGQAIATGHPAAKRVVGDARTQALAAL